MTVPHNAGPAETPPAPVRRKISATVIADSVSPHGDRITTLECTFPRFLLPEFNTHRAFSRNSASSRARSVQRTIQEVRDDPFVPVHWPSERLGMAGGAELSPLNRSGAERLWWAAAHTACEDAEALVLEHVARPVSAQEDLISPRRYNLSGWASLRWFLESGVTTLVE